jgi:hypothetical protein
VRLQIAQLCVRVLDHVVEHPRRHHLVGIAPLVKQAGDLDRMRDERKIVDVTRLAGVALIGEGKRIAG